MNEREEPRATILRMLRSGMAEKLLSSNNRPAMMADIVHAANRLQRYAVNDPTAYQFAVPYQVCPVVEPSVSNDMAVLLTLALTIAPPVPPPTIPGDFSRESPYMGPGWIPLGAGVTTPLLTDPNSARCRPNAVYDSRLAAQQAAVHRTFAAVIGLIAEAVRNLRIAKAEQSRECAGR